MNRKKVGIVVAVLLLVVGLGDGTLLVLYSAGITATISHHATPDDRTGAEKRYLADHIRN